MTDEERAKRVEEIRRLAAQPVVELWADEHVRRLLSELDRVTAERDAALAQVAKLKEAIRTHGGCFNACPRCGEETPNATDGA